MQLKQKCLLLLKSTLWLVFRAEGTRLTGEITSHPKGQPVFDPEDDAIVLGDGTEQRDGLAGDHHLVLRLLRERGRLTWTEKERTGFSSQEYFPQDATARDTTIFLPRFKK